MNMNTNYIARKDGKWGVINNYGKVIIPFEYDRIEEMENEYDDYEELKRKCGITNEIDTSHMVYYWNGALNYIKSVVGKTIHAKWFESLWPIKMDDKVLFVRATSIYQKAAMDKRYKKEIERALEEVTGRKYEIKVIL